MIFVFDFDRTLLDTEKFKKELCGIFKITGKEFDDHVDEFFRKPKKHYSPEGHIKVLKKLGKIKGATEERLAGIKYAKLLKKFGKILFPEVKTVLSKMKKQKRHMVLITVGVPSAQKRKVESAGIAKYFNKIIYTQKQKSKHSYLHKLAKTGGNFLIINDRPEEAVAMQKVLGKNAEIFLVDSPHARKERHNLKIYKGIGELEKFIKT